MSIITPMSNTIELKFGTMIEIHGRVKSTGYEYYLYDQVDAIRPPPQSAKVDHGQTTGYVGFLRAVSEKDGHPISSGYFPSKEDFNHEGTIVTFPANNDNDFIESSRRVIYPDEVPKGLIFRANRLF